MKSHFVIKTGAIGARKGYFGARDVWSVTLASSRILT